MVSNLFLGDRPERFRADAKKVAVASLLGIPRYEEYRKVLDAAIVQRLTEMGYSTPLEKTQKVLVVSYLEQKKEELTNELEAVLDLLEIFYASESEDEASRSADVAVNYSPDEIKEFSREYTAAFKRFYTVEEVQKMYRHVMSSSETTLDTYLSDIMVQVEQSENVTVPTHELGLGWTESLIMAIGYVGTDEDAGE